MKIITTRTAICSWLMLLMLPINLMGQQPWMQETQGKKKTNFYETRQSFNKYWQGKVPEGKRKIPKAKGYKQFKRWEWFWEPRVGKEGIFPSSSVVMQEWDKYVATHPEAKKFSSANKVSPNNRLSGQGAEAAPPPPSTSGGWVSLGPSSSIGGYAGVGRLNVIAFHPTDVNTFWVGSPAGGLWKTTTGGTSWTTLTDNLPVIGVSAMVIDPSNPNIMYIATGDRDGGDTYSVGVLKSTNGGASWAATGLSYNVSQNVLVKGLLIHPANPLILLAATSDGIYRTSNGGTSWTLEQSGNFQEILFKPGDPATVYASSIGSAQIFKSVNTGDTWSQVTFLSGIYRIALAVTPANSSVVGALCSNNTDNGFGGYYTSTNSGTSFTLTYAVGALNLLGYEMDGSDAGGQGSYDLCLAISPTNASVIYTGGVNTWKSTNGGSSWAISTMWYGGTGVPEVHADKHYMAFSPLNSSTLYQCNDGGLYKTSDGGATWTDLSNGLKITQIYRIGNSATNSNLTLLGTQDNGTKLRNASTFTDVIGGDGMEAIIDYTNANVMYGELYYGDIYKSTDGGINWNEITGSLPSGAWVTPYVIDPVNPQVLYAGLNGNVYKTTNGGSTWAAISSALSTSHLQNLAVAPSNTQTIYTGSYYEMYKTTTGGGSWSSVTLPSFQALTSIEVHPTNPQIVWVTFSGYSAGNKVFRSDNGGSTWTNISGTLPNLPANSVEFDKVSGVLYLGNDVGVFVRSPTMTDWQVFDTGLPNVVVNELEIYYNATHTSSRLRAATYGRGLWESDLFTEPVVATYCTPVMSIGCVEGDYINNFSFGTLVNNGSGCNAQPNSFINYSPTGALTTNVTKGIGYSISMQSGATLAQGFGVWIDYNNDKDFDDAGEFVYSSPSFGTGVYTGTITIPTTATAGLRRMRVRSKFNELFTSTQSCTAATYGETEDYTITIEDRSSIWNVRYGGTGTENLGHVIRTSEGGYLLGGYSTSGVSGDRTQATQGSVDYWIVKTDVNGTKLWDKRYGGSLQDQLFTIIQTSDGGYLLGGRSYSGVSGDRTQANWGNADYWIVKITSTGVKQWDRRFGGSGMDDLRKVVQLSTGEYVLAGYSDSPVSGDQTQTPRGNLDYWVVKISSTGAKIWDRRYGGSGIDFLATMVTTSDGFLLGGESNSNISGEVTQNSRGLKDYWLVKINTNGAKVWDKRFGGTADELLGTLVPTSDGFLVAGASASGISGERTQASRGGRDYWVVKINTTGTKLWDQRYGGSSDDNLTSGMVTTADGGFLLGGYSVSGSGGDKSQGSRGSSDYWILKTSSSGAKLWDKRYGGTAADELRSVVPLPDGYLLGGHSASGLNGDKYQGSRGGYDYWLVKVSPAGSATAPMVAATADTPPLARVIVVDETAENEQKILSTSPNPFNDVLKIQFTLSERDIVSLKVFNEKGSEVADLYEGVAEAGKLYTYEWNASHESTGMYIVRLTPRGKPISKKVILAK